MIRESSRRSLSPHQCSKSQIARPGPVICPPAEIEKIVHKEAERQRTSINKAVISLLERRSATHKKKKAGSKEYDDLDSLAGCWSKKEAAEFDKALAAQRKIDPELWK